MNSKKAKIISRRLVTFVALFVLLLFFIQANAITYVQASNLWMIQALGYTSMGYLLLSLSISPLNRFQNRFKILSLDKSLLQALRRHLGICAATFACFHALWVFSTYLQFNWEIVWDWTYLRAGFISLCIFILLLITSFPKLIRLLRINYWKQLHRLVYFVPILLLQHLFLSPFAARDIAIVLMLSFIVLLVLRLIPNR